MCGIFGVIQNSPITSIQQDNYKKSLDTLQHRGPDASGFFCNNNVFLGHQRLSLIDTSDASNQPFLYKSYVIIFNGEIYNFQVLKKELENHGHTFSTQGDTEVLIHAYEQWGEDCVKKLDGMRAFAIYDTITNNIFLSRDRIGEKPLVYYYDDDTFIFGSEIPAILNSLHDATIFPNYNAIANFNTYNFKHIPAPYTAFQGIYKLEPGYSITIKNTPISFSKKKYFEIEKVIIDNNPVEQFISIFTKCVEQTCYADVPIGILLSGGIDSSLITAVLKNRDITTYSLGYDEHDPELIRAKAIAQHLGVKNKQLYFKDYITKERLLKLVQENISFLGEPINLFQIIYSDFLLKEMKKDGIKVVIGGNGADELFYGYDGMNTLLKYTQWKNKIDAFMITPQTLRNDMLKSHIYTYMLHKKDFSKKKYHKFLYKDILKEYANEISSKNLIDIFSWQGLRIDNEHSITIVGDLSGSKNSMEIRSPFLNKDIINFACNLPIEYKVISQSDKTHNKYILKKALEKFLPKELIYQKKMGFGYNLNPLDIIGDTPSYSIPESLLPLYKTSGNYIREIYIVTVWAQLFLPNNK